MLNTYETIFIGAEATPQDKLESTLERVKSVIGKAGGKITFTEIWGRKRLAFPIKRNRDGHYAYIVFTGPAQLPAALDHHYRVTDTILRGITIKVDPRFVDKIRPVSKPVAPAATEQSPEQAASAASAPVSAPASAPAAVQPAEPVVQAPAKS